MITIKRINLSYKQLTPLEEDLELDFDEELLGVHAEEVNQLIFGLLVQSGSRQVVEGK